MPSEQHEVESRRKRWHYSSLKTIEGCPRAWWLEHVAQVPVREKLNSVAGTAYHAAMEAREVARQSGDTPPPLDDLVDVAEASIDEQTSDYETAELDEFEAPASRGKRGRNALLWQARTALRHAHETATPDGVTLVEWLDDHEPVQLEQMLDAPLVDGARDLGGTFDGLYRTPEGELRLVDHKTCGIADGKFHDPGQSAMYGALAVMSGLLDELPNMYFLYAAKRSTSRGAIIIHEPPRLEAVAQLADRIRDAEATVADGRFLPDPTYQWCHTCPFWQRCQGTGELAGPVDEVAERLGAET